MYSLGMSKDGVSGNRGVPDEVLGKARGRGDCAASTGVMMPGIVTADDVPDPANMSLGVSLTKEQSSRG